MKCKIRLGSTRSCLCWGLNGIGNGTSIVVNRVFTQRIQECTVCNTVKKNLQKGGAELGQIQLKLGLACTNIINNKYIARYLVSSLSRPTWHFTPFKSEL